MSTQMRRARMRSATAAASSPASVTFTGKPGRRYRVVFVEASSIGGTGAAALSVTGCEGDPDQTAVAFEYGVDVPAGQFVRACEGLVGKEATDLVVTLGALASSVPKVSVQVIEEPFNV